MKETDPKMVDLFDAYITGALDANERKKQEARLNADPELHKDFVLHQLTVSAVRHSVKKKDDELSDALSNISVDEMRALLKQKSDKFRREKEKSDVAATVVAAIPAVTAAPAVAAQEKPVIEMTKEPAAKKRSWWKYMAGSAAAAVVVIFGFGVFMPSNQKSSAPIAKSYKQAAPKPMPTRSVAPVACADSTEAVEEPVNLAQAKFAIENGIEVEKWIGLLKTEYETTGNKEAGVLLAKAYIKDKEDEKASDLAMELVQKFPDDPEVEELAHKAS